MPWRHVASILSLGAVCAACGSDESNSGVGAACTRTSDCASGLSCAATGLCTAPDSGVPEGGGDASDSGGLDAKSSG
jgi:hypothetical protein